MFEGASRAYISYLKYCKQNYLYAVTLTKHFLLTELLFFSIIASGSYFSHAEAKCMECDGLTPPSLSSWFPGIVVNISLSLWSSISGLFV